MKVEIRGDRSSDFPSLDRVAEVTHVRVVECRYEQWDAIGELRDLVSLEVYGWLPASFDALRPLDGLRQLRIHHLPNVSSLAGLSNLRSLRRLILETRPSWDGSKVTQVDSLEPLRNLPLEEVNMFGVRPESKAVDDLLAIPTLKRARLSKFAAQQIKLINTVVPNEFVTWQEPAWIVFDEVTITTGRHTECVTTWARQVDAREDA